MMLSIPPRYAVSQVIGYIKDESAIHLPRVYGEWKQNFAGQRFLSERIFRLDGRSGRNHDKGIHQEAGRR
jgi:hypothetical protein